MEKRILIVVDFAGIREVIRKTLSNTGYSVYQASDGHEAKRYLDGTRFDLIIVDQEMPFMDGFEFVAYIRKSSFYEYTPVVLLANHITHQGKSKAIELGIAKSIIKPFDVKEFLAIVARITGSRDI